MDGHSTLVRGVDDLANMPPRSSGHPAAEPDDEPFVVGRQVEFVTIVVHVHGALPSAWTGIPLHGHTPVTGSAP